MLWAVLWLLIAMILKIICQGCVFSHVKMCENRGASRSQGFLQRPHVPNASLTDTFALQTYLCWRCVRLDLYFCARRVNFRPLMVLQRQKIIVLGVFKPNDGFLFWCNKLPKIPALPLLHLWFWETWTRWDRGVWYSVMSGRHLPAAGRGNSLNVSNLADCLLLCL